MSTPKTMLALLVSASFVLPAGLTSVSSEGVPGSSGKAHVNLTTSMTDTGHQESYTPQEAELAEALELLMEIPDNVILQGSDAITDWLYENGKLPLMQPRASFWSCTGAILKTLGTTILAPTKILKLKKAIDSAGGVSKVVRVISKHGFNLNRLKAIGGAMGTVIGELTGFLDIKRGCFN